MSCPKKASPYSFQNYIRNFFSNTTDRQINKPTNWGKENVFWRHKKNRVRQADDFA